MNTSDPPLKTVSDVIRDRGGQTAVAKKLGLPRQAVHYWMLRNRIPPEWRDAVTAMFPKGTSLDPSLFGMLSPGSRTVRKRTKPASTNK